MSALCWPLECGKASPEGVPPSRCGGEVRMAETSQSKEETMFLLYGSPDQIIPLASALSAVGGLALVFWGKVIRGVQKLFAWLSGTAGEDEKHQA